MDKLKQDFDIYYLENKNFTDGFESKSHEIQTDKLLSKVGKSGKIAELTVQHVENVSDLGERCNSDFSKRLENIDSQLNGSRSDIRIGSIQARLKKGEDISPDETSRLLLHEMGESKTLTRKSNFQHMLSNADTEQIRKTSQTLADSQDVEKLSWLKEMVSLKGEAVLSNTIQAQLDGVKDSLMSDEQRNLKIISERIKKGMQLFEYSIARSKTGVFIDARQDEIQ